MIRRVEKKRLETARFFAMLSQTQCDQWLPGGEKKLDFPLLF
jgi:hypothetical protein